MYHKQNEYFIMFVLALFDLIHVSFPERVFGTQNVLKITQNVSFLIFQFWHYPPKWPDTVTLFDRKLFSKKLGTNSILSIFWYNYCWKFSIFSLASTS